MLLRKSPVHRAGQRDRRRIAQSTRSGLTGRQASEEPRCSPVHYKTQSLQWSRHESDVVRPVCPLRPMDLTPSREAMPLRRWRQWGRHMPIARRLRAGRTPGTSTGGRSAPQHDSLVSDANPTSFRGAPAPASEALPEHQRPGSHERTNRASGLTAVVGYMNSVRSGAWQGALRPGRFEQSAPIRRSCRRRSYRLPPPISGLTRHAWDADGRSLLQLSEVAACRRQKPGRPWRSPCVAITPAHAH